MVMLLMVFMIIWGTGSFMPLLFGILVLVLFLIFHLICNQEKMLYVPDPMGNCRKPEDNPAGYQSPKEFGMQFENVYFTTSDQVKLHAWWMPAHGDVKGTLVFCHANAGNIGMRLPNYFELVRRMKLNVFAFDYRGFGNSEGEPEEKGIILDALAALEYVKSTYNIPKCWIFGRSLGGAVAIAVARQIESYDTEVARHFPQIQGLLLENTFTCISELADKIFSFLSYVRPIKDFFLRVKWESNSRIREVRRAKILFLVGEQDELVPPVHSRLLQQFCVTARGGGHLFSGDCDFLANSGIGNGGRSNCGTGNTTKRETVASSNAVNDGNSVSPKIGGIINNSEERIESIVRFFKSFYNNLISAADSTTTTGENVLKKDGDAGCKTRPQKAKSSTLPIVDSSLHGVCLASFPDGTHNDTYQKGGKVYWKVIQDFIDEKQITQ